MDDTVEDGVHSQILINRGLVEHKKSRINTAGVPGQALEHKGALLSRIPPSMGAFSLQVYWDRQFTDLFPCCQVFGNFNTVFTLLTGFTDLVYRPILSK